MHGLFVQVRIQLTESLLSLADTVEESRVKGTYRVVARFPIAREINVPTTQIHYSFKVTDNRQWPFVTGRVMRVRCIAHIDDHGVIQHVPIPFRDGLQALGHLGNQAKEPASCLFIVGDATGIPLITTHVAKTKIAKIDSDAEIGLSVDFGSGAGNRRHVTESADQSRSGQFKLGF